MKKCLLLILFLASLNAGATTHAWITNKVEVPMRTGPGNQYRIVKTVISGVELTVGDESGGYTRVTLESGEEGWVPTRYLSNSPVAHQQMEENTKRQAALFEENKRLAGELEAMKSAKGDADKSNQELAEENSRLNSEITAIRQASANVLQIQNERDQLTQEKVNLENQLDTLNREKQSQDASNRQDWFMIGAGVLFGGILLGLILPRLSWRKKSSWDSF